MRRRGRNGEAHYLWTECSQFSEIRRTLWAEEVRKARYNWIDLHSILTTPAYLKKQQDSSNSDSDNLDDIDQLPSQSIPPRLVSLSQNLTASQLPPSTAPVMTRTARGITQKKTYEQERLENRESVDCCGLVAMGWSLCVGRCGLAAVGLPQ